MTVCNKFRSLLNELNHRCKLYKNSEYYKKMDHKFYTKAFTSASEAAQLGFALSKSNDGIKYDTEAGFVKTLKFVGNYFTDDDYEQYKNKARCLGDVLAIANVHKLADNIQKGLDENIPCYYIGINNMRYCIEMIIAVAYMYESTAMKLYVDKHKDKLEALGVKIPDYDDIVSTDYKLSKELRMYYASGFNVFLNDNKYRKFKYHKDYLTNAALINYRQLGNSTVIEHPMITDELASILRLVTNIDGTYIDSWVGSLRFI